MNILFTSFVCGVHAVCRSFFTAAALLVFICCSGHPSSARVPSADTTARRVAGDSGNAGGRTLLPVGVSRESVQLLERLQNANRQVTAEVLPSVVTLDVVETRKVRVRDPFGGFPWFFFRGPEGPGAGPGGGSGNKGEAEEREYKTEGLGSGVIVKKTGKTHYVLTNYHVAGKANEIEIKLHYGRIVKGKLVGGDQRKDIALVSFEDADPNIRVAVLGDSDAVRVGDIVFAVGSPLGYTSTVTQGIISALGRFGGPGNNINDFIQTDAAINQGNSGGPMVNIYGEVIGINAWIASSSGGSQGIGFSIPINNVKSDIESFIQYGQVKYGWLGVQLVATDADTVASLGIAKGTKGVLAAEIFLGSPAHKGGLKPGDYCVKLNGKEVKDVNQFVRDVGALRIGQTAVFDLIRGGVPMTLSVRITERDEKIVNDYSKLWPGFIPLPLTEAVRKRLDLKASVRGVLVSNAQSKSPAALMGLKSADIVVAVNDQRVSSVREFYAVLARQTREVWFDVLRDGQTLSTVRFRF